MSPPMRRGACLLAVAGAVALAAGCSREALPGPDVAARVDGREIEYAAFEAYLEENSVETEATLGSDVLSVLFDRFIDEELLAALAAERGLSAPGAPRRAAMEALAAAIAAEPIDDDEIAAYYRAHRMEFQLPERVRLRQLLVEDPKVAERIQRELASGVAFEAVGREVSGEAVVMSGDQGLLGRDELPPAFVEPIFALEPGEISPPIAADYGFHFFQVLERFPAGTVPLAEAAPGIRRELARRGAAARFERVAEEARERYTVRVFERNLPFNYSGLRTTTPDDEAD